MLILSRKAGQSLMLGDGIEITITEISGDKVKLGISAPADVKVYRKELYSTIQENQSAAAPAQSEALRNLLRSSTDWREELVGALAECLHKGPQLQPGRTVGLENPAFIVLGDAVLSEFQYQFHLDSQFADLQLGNIHSKALVGGQVNVPGQTQLGQGQGCDGNRHSAHLFLGTVEQLGPESMGFLRRECGSGLSRQTGIVQKGNSSSGQHFIGDCHDLQQILGREIDLIRRTAGFQYLPVCVRSPAVFPFETGEQNHS